jgi:hypothetical protein
MRTPRPQRRYLVPGQALRCLNIGSTTHLSIRPMSPPIRKHRHTVWALLGVAPDSERDILRFFIDRVGLPPKVLRRDLHLTIYHARRLLRGLFDHRESLNIVVEPMYLRFMVMAPGGENPRPDLDPARRSVGVRVKRGCPALAAIHALRSRFYLYETPTVLGVRRPSNHNRNAFGAAHYQPHINLLRAGSGIDRDLTKLGSQFRAAIPTIRFDRLIVRCRSVEDAGTSL